MQNDDSDEGYLLAVGSGALEGAAATMKAAGKAMLKDTPAVTRYVLTRIPKGPGFIADLADLATAKDKWRAGVGILGGMAGGAIGELGGPIGAGVGAAAGEAGSQWVYDHRAELAQKAAEIARWMKDPAAERAASLAPGFVQGAPPYAPVMR